MVGGIGILGLVKCVSVMEGLGACVEGRVLVEYAGVWREADIQERQGGEE